MGTEGPTGKPTPGRPANVFRVPKDRPSTPNEGFGPDGRKKLKTAAVPIGPTTAAAGQLGAAKPVASAPGATTKMLPVPWFTQVFGGAVLGTWTSRGLGKLRPAA